MLSATPVNTSLTDLRNQIYLMTGKREDVFSNSLGVSNIRDLIRQAQKAFKAWEENASKDGRCDHRNHLGTDKITKTEIVFTHADSFNNRGIAYKLTGEIDRATETKNLEKNTQI